MKHITKSAITRTAVQYRWVLVVALGVACSKKAAPAGATGGPIASTAKPVTSASAVSGAAAGAMLGCVARSTSFSLGPVEGDTTTENDSLRDSVSDAERPSELNRELESSEDLPFGVSVGVAVAHGTGFAVTAIDARPGESHAVLALLDAEVARGRVLDLGRVYGDAEPPRVVLRGDAAFVVVPDLDAAGNNYRYGWVRGLDTANRVEWLGSFQTEVDDSAALAVASTDATITVAWDEVDAKSRKSRVRWASLDPEGKPLGAASATPTAAKRRISPGWVVSATDLDRDAEAPQLVAHRSGYWLGYLVSDAELLRGKHSRTVGPAKSRVAPGGDKPPGERSGSEEEVRAVELGRRSIALLPLDLRGMRSGNPIWVTERAAHVVTFDVEATADGGALVAYRDADATPGVEERIIEVARVRPDGSIERYRIDDERVGAGMPVLLVAASGEGANAAWLAVAGRAGETRLAQIPGRGGPVLELVEEPHLASVEPMLRRGDSLLVARHRARFVEFERMDCTWSTPH